MRPLVLFAAFAVFSCSRAPIDPCRPVRGETIVVTRAEARTAAAGQPTSAAYLTVCNVSETPDALVAVATPAAAAAELHQTTRDANAVVAMAKIDRIALPSGVPVTLEPGATHIMLIGLRGAIEEGAAVALELRFEAATPVVVDAIAHAPGAEHGH